MQYEWEVPIVVTGIGNTPMLFSNMCYVQHHQTEFIITFCELQPPILVGTTEEMARQAAALDIIPARVVARIALTSTRMTELIRALQENLSNYEKTRGG